MSGFSTSVLPASLGAVLALDQPGGSSSTSSRRRLKPTAPSYGSVHGGQTLGLDGPLAQLAWRAHHPTSPVAWVLIMVVVVSLNSGSYARHLTRWSRSSRWDGVGCLVWADLGIAAGSGPLGRSDKMSAHQLGRCS